MGDAMMDEVIAVCPFRDYILIFTRDRKVYKMKVDDYNGEPVIHLWCQL
jgi:hypothetical protein